MFGIPCAFVLFGIANGQKQSNSTPAQTDSSTPIPERATCDAFFISGSEHPDVATSYNNMANTCDQLGQYVTRQTNKKKQT